MIDVTFLPGQSYSYPEGTVTYISVLVAKLSITYALLSGAMFLLELKITDSFIFFRKRYVVCTQHSLYS